MPRIEPTVGRIVLCVDAARRTCKHTPTPWLLRTWPDGAFVISDKDDLYVIASRSACDHRYPEMAANARLMAAAPMLLASLEEVCEAWRATGQPVGHVWDRAMAVIAKAEGKS